MKRGLRAGPQMICEHACVYVSRVWGVSLIWSHKIELRRKSAGGLVNPAHNLFHLQAVAVVCAVVPAVGSRVTDTCLVHSHDANLLCYARTFTTPQHINTSGWSCTSM